MADTVTVPPEQPVVVKEKRAEHRTSYGALAVGLVLLVVIVFLVLNVVHQNRVISDAQKQLSDSRAETAKVQSELDEIKSSTTQSQAQLDAAKAQVLDLQAQLDRSKAASSQTQSQLDAAKTQTADMQSQLNKSRAQETDFEAQLKQANAASYQQLSQINQDKIRRTTSSRVCIRQRVMSRSSSRCFSRPGTCRFQPRSSGGTGPTSRFI